MVMAAAENFGFRTLSCNLADLQVSGLDFAVKQAGLVCKRGESDMTASRNFFTEEDALWMRSVLSLIPKAVYGGDKSVLASVSEKAGRGNDLISNPSAAEKRKKKRSSQKKKKTNKEGSKNVESESAGRSVLKEKLHERILEKRTERKADDETHVALRAERKRKREERNAHRAKELKRARRDQKFQNLKQQADMLKAPEGSTPVPAEQISPEVTDEAKPATKDLSLETTRLSGFSDEGKKVKKVKRRKLRGSKLRELQMQLETATKEKELKEKAEVDSSGKLFEKDTATAGTESAVKVSKAVVDREMEKALQRTKGVEVRDDVQKLKKSIRREKRKTAKSKEEWAKRVQTLEKEKVAKQERREKNLKERKENKGKSGKGKPGKKIHKKRKS